VSNDERRRPAVEHAAGVREGSLHCRGERRAAGRDLGLLFRCPDDVVGRMSLDRDGRDQLACDGELGAEEILGVRLARRYLDREGAHMGGVVVDERRAAREVSVSRPGPPVVVQCAQESLSAAEWAARERCALPCGRSSGRQQRTVVEAAVRAGAPAPARLVARTRA